jgi:hypothetical protein
MIRAIQYAARRQRGTAIISVKVVVDAEGHPHFWTTPEVTKIEPANGDDLVKMLASEAPISEKV